MFGPFKGAALFVVVFFFPGFSFFRRASAAAARSARIFSLSSFVRFGFTTGAGTSSSRFMEEVVGGEDCCLTSSTEPSLFPWQNDYEFEEQ